MSGEFLFPIEKFVSPNTSMHCATEEEANIFLEFLYSKGKRWCSGDSYLSTNNFHHFGTETCYFFNCGTVGSRAGAASKGMVLEFSDYWVEGELEKDDRILDEFLSSFSSS